MQYHPKIMARQMFAPPKVQAKSKPRDYVPRKPVPTETAKAPEDCLDLDPYEALSMSIKYKLERQLFGSASSANYREVTGYAPSPTAAAST